MTKPTFERRHFNFIARALASMRPAKGMHRERAAQWEFMVDTFTTQLSATNATFNRSRFLEACGIRED